MRSLGGARRSGPDPGHGSRHGVRLLAMLPTLFAAAGSIHATDRYLLPSRIPHQLARGAADGVPVCTRDAGASGPGNDLPNNLAPGAAAANGHGTGHPPGNPSGNRDAVQLANATTDTDHRGAANQVRATAVHGAGAYVPSGAANANDHGPGDSPGATDSQRDRLPHCDAPAAAAADRHGSGDPHRAPNVHGAGASRA